MSTHRTEGIRQIIRGRGNRAGMSVPGAFLLALALPLFSIATEPPAGQLPPEAAVPPPPGETVAPVRSAAELQQDLLKVREQYVQARRDLFRCQTGVDEGAGKELLAETQRLRQEILRVESQAESSPEQAELLADQARQLRQTLYAKEAERTALLNQSEEYRTLSARESDLHEQMKDMLQKLQDTPAEPSGTVEE